MRFRCYDDATYIPTVDHIVKSLSLLVLAMIVVRRRLSVSIWIVVFFDANPAAIVNHRRILQCNLFASKRLDDRPRL